MTSYVIKRIASAILTVFLIATLTFFLMNLVPGGPFASEKAPTPAVQAAMEAKYGLDKPLIDQYGNYLNNLLHGDFGISLKQRGRSINEIIGDTFPVSARIGGMAIIIALIFGVPMGSIAALKRGKAWDNIIMVISTLGIAVPGFVLATFLMITFSGKLPTMGLYTSSSYILPVFTLAFYPMAYITRLTRSSMLDVLGQDYIRTAKAKGVSSRDIILHHALKNSLIPVITYFGPMLAYIVTGSLVVEKIFAVPGIGRAFVNSIIGRDYPLIMGTTIILATLIVIMNLVSDILYKIADPRITLE